MERGFQPIPRRDKKKPITNISWVLCFRKKACHLMGCQQVGGMGQKQPRQFPHRRGDISSPLCAAEDSTHYYILQFGPTRKTRTNWKESSSEVTTRLVTRHRVYEETLRELGFSSLEKKQLGSSHWGHPLPEWWSWKKQRQTLPEADKDRTWWNR